MPGAAMSCGVCSVSVCPHCGKLHPVRAASCPHCGWEIPKKTCPYCGQAFRGYTGDPPVCPHCCRELPREFL